MKWLASSTAAVLAAAMCPGLVAGAGAAAAQTAAAARAAAANGTWRKAEEVPGTAARNTGGFAVSESVSCGSAGNCGGGGYYSEATGPQQAFVAAQTNGRWGRAKAVAVALNVGGGAEVTSVSCASAGNCGAGGDYVDRSGRSEAFVVLERNGRWEKAEEVPGTAALNKGIGAEVTSVSCAPAGNCGAGGYYTDGSGHTQAFVVSARHGRWGTAREVPGTATLNKGGAAEVSSVSCASAGNCSAGGSYASRHNRKTGVYVVQAFVVSARHGRWGTAREVPGTAALNKGGFAQVKSVSCASPGNCGAGGSYTDAAGFVQAFVVSARQGRWGTARKVPGTAALNKGGHALVNSVSCASAGNCSAGGQYSPLHAGGEAFVVKQTNGRWGTAREVGAALNKGGLAGISSVSCASAGNCSAGGFYTDASAGQQALVIDERNGTWGTAKELPGTAALNLAGRAAVQSVSCATATHCGAGGEYLDGNFGQQAFVASKT